MLMCKLKNAANRPETTDQIGMRSRAFIFHMNHTIGNRVFGYDNARCEPTSGQTDCARKALCSAFPFGHTVVTCS